VGTGEGARGCPGREAGATGEAREHGAGVTAERAKGGGGGQGREGRGLMDFHAAIRTAVPWKLVRGSIMQHCVQF
jgi:hypothetical protein